jgi:monoamine oxidase
LGAGIAGITAARNLQAKGCRVLLLEGSDRIGGRIYSVREVVRNPVYAPRSINAEKKDEFLPIEAGAEFIHVKEKDENDFYLEYKEFWAEIHKQGFTASAFHKFGFVDPPEIPRNRLFFRDWGRTYSTMDPSLIMDLDIVKVGFLLDDLKAFNPDRKEDLPASKYVQEKYKGGRSRLLANYTLSAHTPGLPATISVGGISADRIPHQLMETDEFRLELERADGHKICGYDTLPTKILEEFLGLGGALKISKQNQTDMRVKKVVRSADGIITVTTEGGEKVSGRSAVCTFSVGMLDPNTGKGSAIFGDLLTQQKRKALQMVKMGPITKFSLEFKERVWTKDDLMARYMSVLSYPEGNARTFFSAFPDQTGGPHVLTGLLMGEDHKRISQIPDDAQAAQYLLDVIQEVFDPEGKQAGNNWTVADKLIWRQDAHGTQRPNVSRKDWGKDEFAKGGNSFLKFLPKDKRPMKVTKVREALKNPRQTLPLFWAGEATAPAYDKSYQPLSVHGAYISGVRVSEDVYHLLKVAKGNKERFEKYYKKKYLSQKT